MSDDSAIARRARLIHSRSEWTCAEIVGHLADEGHTVTVGQVQKWVSELPVAIKPPHYKQRHTTLEQMSEMAGIPLGTLKKRLESGYPLEMALTKPVRQLKKAA